MFTIATNSFYNTQDQVVFKAQSGDSKVRSKELFETDATNSISAKTQKTNQTQVSFFSDNQKITLNLQNESMALLKSHFLEEDFIHLKDGSIGLNGKANAYVDGWFKDVARERNFLKADKDSDGVISHDEHRYFKNSVKDEYSVQDLRSLGHLVLRHMDNSEGYKSSDANTKAVSLEEVLSQTINSDKNFDGKLTRLEYATKGESLEQGYENMARDTASFILGSRQDKTTFLIDPTGEKMSAMDGKTFDEVKNFFTLPKMYQSSAIKESYEDSEQQQLLDKFPEYKALIQNNPNITQAQLESLKEKSQAIKSYMSNVFNFDRQFSQSMLSFNLQA